MSKTLRNWIIVLGLGLIVWICPTPEGLTPKAWHLFAIFIATIAGFILQPISMGAVAFLVLTFCAVTGVLKTGEALMGFGNGTIWLIVCAFFLSRGFIKTGFGKRIAFVIIKYIGRSSLSLWAIPSLFQNWLSLRLCLRRQHAEAVCFIRSFSP